MIIDMTGRYGENLLKNDADTVSEEFKGFYYLYEYSDNINVITDNPQYPTLLNYVKTGLLTEDEMLEALLHK